MFQVLLVTLFAVVARSQDEPLIDMSDSISRPLMVIEGDDALLTCVARNVKDDTVLWKKGNVILTAGNSRVTSDKRISVFHDEGGDVWVLAIKQSHYSDTGTYVCEVNSDPTVRSFHGLKVISTELRPPPSLIPPESTSPGTPSEVSRHNFTDCCANRNVSQDCIGFCDLDRIIGNTVGTHPDECEPQFPDVVHCMADGRNHVPCCIDSGVPDICLEICRGEYSVQTDNIKSHISCSAFTERILGCIGEGIRILPAPPKYVEVNALSENSLEVKWLPPDDLDILDHYMINVTRLAEFDIPDRSEDSVDIEIIQESGEKKEIKKKPTETPKAMQIMVPKSLNKTTIKTLSAFSMYEITVLSVNDLGSSLPTYTIREMTLSPNHKPPVDPEDAPELPDTRKCCEEAGVTESKCLDHFCDPLGAQDARLVDMMICAPWAKNTFPCITNGIDHTDCCRRRGMKDICLELCHGNITKIDYKYFKCMHHMEDYQSCLLVGYGVVPSEPRDLYISNVNPSYAVVHWSPPETLNNTINGYLLHYRDMKWSNETYRKKRGVNSPFLLDGLEHKSKYEVYVEAVNEHGVGEPSSRIIFETMSRLQEENLEDSGVPYNLTECCQRAGLKEECMPLCSYNAKMSEITSRAATCGTEFYNILRCTTGGRNHQACCERRGVHVNCISLCSGVMTRENFKNPSFCLPFVGNMITCFEEGTGVIPSPVLNVHATKVTNSSVTLVWNEANEGPNVTLYQVHYEKRDPTIGKEFMLNLENTVNVTEPFAVIENLTEHLQYSFFVVAINEYGSSLPSSVLNINATNIDLNGDKIHGQSSAPHSLAVVHKATTEVTISWMPPEFSHPTDRISYRLYFMELNKTKLESISVLKKEDFETKTTVGTSMRLSELVPNTQYIVYLVTVTDKGESHPSETVLAWTDPAYPPFVEPPTIHPSSLILEGSTITVLCIAMGAPMPLVSLYISGLLYKEEKTRHMVAVVKNVTRSMDKISCYADNGYGTPAFSTGYITISRHPRVSTNSEFTLANYGASAVLECRIDAWPEPNMIWWRDPEGRTPVIHGGDFSIPIFPDIDEKGHWIMQLQISRVTEETAGSYYCHAENAFGGETRNLTVQAKPKNPSVLNITDCCIKENVSPDCIDACAFDVDFNSIANRAKCIPEFHKLMKCAADGSDHRYCCTQWGVPRRCLDWCRGEPVVNSPLCILSSTKQIIACFEENKALLPGPPQTVTVEEIDVNSVRIGWDIPVKNPHVVEVYRIFWRKKEDTETRKNDTRQTSIVLNRLEEGTSYEIRLKAGNHYGISQFTEPIQFRTLSRYVSTSSTTDTKETYSRQVSVAVGVVVSIIIMALLALFVLYYLRKNGKLGLKQTNTNGVSFENPSYMRENNGVGNSENSQVSTVTENVNGGIHSELNGGSGGINGWRSETLHAGQSGYEELRLGQDSAGFRKLSS